MSIGVTIREYGAPSLDKNEILRYMRCKESSAEIDSLIDKTLLLAQNKLSYKVCYNKFPVSIKGNKLDLGFVTVESSDLKKCLVGCDEIILFAATVGLEIDRLIKRYGISEPSVSLCLQAIGSERVEALCDRFCHDLTREYEGVAILRPRFSAGYGDLPLSLQKNIFSALSCDKHIGITLNESMIMSPSKSVTAIIGIKKVKNENS